MKNKDLINFLEQAPDDFEVLILDKGILCDVESIIEYKSSIISISKYQ